MLKLPVPMSNSNTAGAEQPNFGSFPNGPVAGVLLALCQQFEVVLGVILLLQILTLLFLWLRKQYQINMPLIRFIMLMTKHFFKQWYKKNKKPLLNIITPKPVLVGYRLSEIIWNLLVSDPS
jgi:hypothetical protein